MCERVFPFMQVWEKHNCTNLEGLREVPEGEHVVVTSSHGGGAQDVLDTGQQLTGGIDDGVLQLLGQRLTVVFGHVAVQHGVHDAVQGGALGLGQVDHNKVTLIMKNNYDK